MAKLPVYVQRYQVGSRRASAEDFGAGEARAKAQFGDSMMGLGDTLAVIEDRRQTRKETIERVRAKNEMVRLAEQKMTQYQTENDMTDTALPNQYAQFLEDELNKIVENHPGRDISRDALKADLLGIKQQYSSALYKQSVKAGFDAISMEMNNAIKGFADFAGDRPDTVEAQFEALDVKINDLAPALPEGAENEYREMGRQQILNSAVQTYLTTGDFEAADAVLSGSVNGTPIAEILGPDNMRSLKSKVIIGQRENEKGQIAAQQKLTELRTILGREPTAEERVRAAGVAPPKGSQTVAEKIAEFETAVGRPASSDEIQKFYDIDSSTGTSGMFGKSIRGRTLDIMNEYVVGFQNGTLTPDQERVFMSAVHEYTSPESYQDPDTGMIMKRVPKLPQHVQQAMGRRGIPVAEDAQQSPAVSLMDSDQGPTPDQTIWSRRGNIAGPIPVGMETVGKIPGVGGLVEGGGEYARDRQYARGIQRDLVRVLQNNPKYAEGERKAIEQEISIMSQFLDDPTAYQNRLIGLDENLQARQDFAYRTANNPAVSREERQAAMNILNAVTRFREYLGVPVRVKSAEEAKKLPSGTEFVTPDGRLMRIREGVADAAE